MTKTHQRNPNTACLTCVAPIYRRPSEIRHGRVFCSISCRAKADSKESPCVICGTLILASAHKKTCGRGCANAHRAGMVYKINRPSDKVTTQRALKLRLLSVRGTKCERCTYAKGKILQVHHTDRNRANNWLANLELVCPNCHAKEHCLMKSWLGRLAK